MVGAGGGFYPPFLLGLSFFNGTTHVQLEEKITTLISDSLHVAGYELVRVLLRDGKGRTLQIMIDRLDEKDITIRDCEKASRLISAIIDVNDPIEGEYNLEVSSPGIDRPLVRLKDFARFAGLEAKIATLHPVNGRKRFTGRLVGIDGDIVQLQLAGEDIPVGIGFDNIHNAKLVMNDELMAQAANKKTN